MSCACAFKQKAALQKTSKAATTEIILIARGLLRYSGKPVLRVHSASDRYFSKLEACLGGYGVAFERVLRTELVIPLGDQCERRHRVGAECIGQDWAHTIDPRLEIAEPRADPTIGSRLDHCIGYCADAKRTEILGDRAIDVEKISARVVGLRIFKVHGISKCGRSLPLRLGIKIGDGGCGYNSPMVETRVSEVALVVFAVGAKPVTPTFHHQFPLFQPSAIGVTPVSPKLVSVSPKVTSNGPKVLPKGPVKFVTVKPTSVSIDMKAGAAPKAKLPPRIFHL